MFKGISTTTLRLIQSIFMAASIKKYMHTYTHYMQICAQACADVLLFCPWIACRDFLSGRHNVDRCVCMTHACTPVCLRNTYACRALYHVEIVGCEHAVIKHTCMHPRRSERGSRFIEATHSLRIRTHTYANPYQLTCPVCPHLSAWSYLHHSASPHCHVLDSSLGSARCHVV